MQRYIARIIRALIVSCLGFGGGIGLMVTIATLCLTGNQKAFEYGLNAGLLFGGIFAFMLVGVLLPLDLSTHLFLAKQGNRPELWELEQVRDLELEGSLKEVTALARRALLLVPNVKSVKEDAETNTIQASIGTSWRSSGEQMRVEITPVSSNPDAPEAADKWRLRCYSSSPSKNIVFDYGKNFENVDSFERHITRLITDKDRQPA